VGIGTGLGGGFGAPGNTCVLVFKSREGRIELKASNEELVSLNEEL
jgi:hypothetical protein